MNSSITGKSIFHFKVQLHYKIKEKSTYSTAFVFLLLDISKHSRVLTFKVGKILPSRGGGHSVTIYLFIPCFGFFEFYLNISRT